MSDEKKDPRALTHEEIGEIRQCVAEAMANAPDLGDRTEATYDPTTGLVTVTFDKWMQSVADDWETFGRPNEALAERDPGRSA
jgi:hypothetical protein